MIVDKPPWVDHGGSQIFSVDVHPDATRFATAGGDHKVKIWSMGPLLDASEEDSPEQPRLLATLADHFGPVNVVRFSSDGAFVASGSDDNLVCIHEHKQGPGCAALFGSNDSPNHENWSQAMSLRGHSSNVTGLTWAPDGSMVASCSLDNTVIVWDTSSGGRVATLSAHNSCVKGVAWDPIGRYLASQADDKSVVLWKAEDWSQVARVEACFTDSSTSTFTLRPSWTVDGSTLMTPNVAEPPCQCAAAIDRGNWTSDFKLVGHKAPVVACAVNPKLFVPSPKQSNSDGTAANGAEANDEDAVSSHCVALGSQDQRLSVWLTSKSQPVLIAKTVFEAGVNDLAWTPDGFTLVACSIDGSIAVFTFTEAELGRPLPKEQVDDLLSNLYGEAPGMKRSTKFVESVAQLELEVQASAKAPNGAAPPVNGVAKPQQPKKVLPKAITAKPKPLPKQPLQQSVVSNTAAIQVESRTKDGRRRVNPVQMDTGSPLARGSLPPAASAFASASFPGAAPSAQPAGAMGPPPLQPIAAPGPSQQQQQQQRPLHGGGSAAGVWRGAAEGSQGSSSGLQPAPLYASLEAELPSPAPHAPAPPPSSELASVRYAAARSSGAGASEGPRAVVTVNNKKSVGSAATLSCSVPRQVVGAAEGSSSLRWNLSLASPCLLLAAGEKLVAAALADGSLMVLSPGGRLLLPPLALGIPAAHLKVFGWRILVASGASVRLWDVRQQELIGEADLWPVFAMAGSGNHMVDMDLSPRGEPVVVLSNRQAFVLHTGMRSWMRVADDRFPSSPFHSAATGASSSSRGALASLHQRAAQSPLSIAQRSPSSLLRAGSGSIHHHREATAHLEGSIASAAVLGDAEGYRRALRIHCRQLADAGDEERLRDMFTDLLGPVELQGLDDPWNHDDGGGGADEPGSGQGPPEGDDDGDNGNDDDSPWSAHVLGLPKIGLLREVLPMVAATRSVPGLVAEFQDLLADLDAGRATLPPEPLTSGAAAAALMTLPPSAPAAAVPSSRAAAAGLPSSASALGKRRRSKGGTSGP